MDQLDIAKVGRRSVQGISALISRTFFLNIISYGASLVIFTILSPREIGVYTAAIAGQRIISFFADFGLGAALVQRREQLTRDDLTTVFTLQMLTTFFLFLLVIFTQGFIVSFFKLGEAGARLFLVLVFLVFLSSFKTIPSILLERAINFQKLIVPQIIEAFIFNLVLVALVLKGLGIDGYTWAFLIAGIVGIPFYYLVSPWKIGIGITRKSLGHLRYGIQFQAKNVLATVKDDFLTVFLAKILSFAELGYIGFAQRNAFFAYRFIVDNVTKVTFSTYSRLQNNKKMLKNAIEKSLFFVSASIFPLLLGIIITAPYIVSYFPKWQGKWEPALLSLTFFSLNALISSLSGILVNVLDATGRVKLTLKLMTLWTLLTWIFTPILIYLYGYNGVSIASFLIALTIVLTIFLVKKVVEFSFFKSILKPLACSIIMAIFVFVSAPLYVKDLLTLGIIIGGGALIYAISLYSIARRDLEADIKMIFAKT
ncbi:MAG: oligosaccharide flippase family protein [Candidatus Levybacteria bacterium]|nr:oligosaccharide flippase family protein [Candidatus Levybacteria bacterium]